MLNVDHIIVSDYRCLRHLIIVMMGVASLGSVAKLKIPGILLIQSRNCHMDIRRGRLNLDCGCVQRSLS